MSLNLEPMKNAENDLSNVIKILSEVQTLENFERRFSNLFEIYVWINKLSCLKLKDIAKHQR